MPRLLSRSAFELLQFCNVDIPEEWVAHMEKPPIMLCERVSFNEALFYIANEKEKIQWSS